MGQTGEGLALLAEAQTFVETTGERLYETELYRLKGELTLTQSSVQRLGASVKTGQKSKVKNPKGASGWRLETESSSQTLSLKSQASRAVQEAEECFYKAIEIAQRQQAKSLELRATTSLARLWQRQGRRHEARQMLAEIYGWFTEGFETKDLQDAKALLEELNR